MEVDVNNRKKMGKVINMWNLNNTLNESKKKSYCCQKST